MSEIYYNDTVKQAMKKLSTSTNVLEDYDNFTYNITLYMYDYDTESSKESQMGALRKRLIFHRTA